MRLFFGTMNTAASIMLSAVVIQGSAFAHDHGNDALKLCPTTAQKTRIMQEVTDYPGDPITIVARDLKVPEFTAVSSLPAKMAVGAWINGEQAQELWKSIDAWGKDTMVRLLFTPSSQHAFIVHDKVPVTQPNPEEGYLDVYADEGNGIHSHIQLNTIASIYASDLPTDDPKYRTRGINFYDQQGHSVIGVYASIKTYEPDPAAIAGFERTKAEIAKLSNDVCP
ncbi:ChuX/HutX family heme-like substrate-binding protein [Kordiimonas pumila]|uniref:ChuX/HutX family heme-like substrate-binding protein n=1 Tax=Kordiimonas pumila TaxID=2161677 RepID=A0ABV7D8J4_9PROT|nr:ChuX/HutX family heme-like substrate-binding protein [Kordiimonas pumila]